MTSPFLGNTGIIPESPEPGGFFGLYRGVVTNTTDPAAQNRIKAIVPQLFGNTSTEIDWALPCQLPGVQSTPAPGQGVWISFEGGDINYPIYMGMWQAEPSVAPYVTLAQLQAAVAAAVSASGTQLPTLAGVLANNYTTTAVLTTFMSTLPLSIGTWIVTVTVMANLGQGAASQSVADIIMVAGTATATFAGPTSGEIRNDAASSINDAVTGQVTLTTVVTVTSPGTVAFQAVAPGTNKPVISTLTPSGPGVNATGWTATLLTPNATTNLGPANTSLSNNPTGTLVAATVGTSMANNTVVQVTNLTPLSGSFQGNVIQSGNGLVVPVTGNYRITAQLMYQAPPLGSDFFCLINRNGTQILSNTNASYTTAFPAPIVAFDSYPLNAGDVITMGGFQNTGSTQTTSFRGSVTGGDVVWLSITLVSLTGAPSATPVTYVPLNANPAGAIYQNVNFGMASSGTFTGTSTLFMRGGMTTNGVGELIIPVAGIYQCSASWGSANAASGGGSLANVSITKNGSVQIQNQGVGISAGFFGSASIAGLIQCAVGDILQWTYFNNCTGMTCAGSPNETFLHAVLVSI